MQKPESLNSLRTAIEKKVKLESTPICLGGKKLDWLRVANPDDLLELAVEVDAEGIEARHDPFWAATWRAALGLDAFLANVIEPGVRVLELGCGSGQAGVGAALRGAQVTSTDSVELAMQVAQLNAWELGDRIEYHTLVWGRGCLRGDTFPPFPILIGSDLVYDPALFESLEQCARQHLATDGRMYLSEPHRHSGDKFSTWIREAGWNTVEHDQDLRDGRVMVRVFECWL